MQQDANRTPLIRTLMPLIIVIVWILILIVIGGKGKDKPKALVTIETGGSVSAIDWSPDGSKLVSGGSAGSRLGYDQRGTSPAFGQRAKPMLSIGVPTERVL